MGNGSPLCIWPLRTSITIAFKLLNDDIALPGDGIIYILKLFDLMLLVLLGVPDQMLEIIRCTVSITGDVIYNKKNGRNKEA